MNDNEKESNLHSHSGKNISPSSHISFLSEKKKCKFLYAYTYGCFHLTPKNKESEELGMSWSQEDGLKQGTV